MQHVAVGMEHLQFEINVQNNNNITTLIKNMISHSLRLKTILALPGS